VTVLAGAWWWQYVIHFARLVLGHLAWGWLIATTCLYVVAIWWHYVDIPDDGQRWQREHAWQRVMIE
jgi:hypothetical protein